MKKDIEEELKKSQIYKYANNLSELFFGIYDILPRATSWYHSDKTGS